MRINYVKTATNIEIITIIL